MKFKVLLVAFFGLVLNSATSYGQILTFEFSALAGSEASAVTNTNDINITNSTITRGAGLTSTANGGRFNATAWALTSISNAVIGNNYMEFTITPNAGFQFTVSSIIVQWQRSATGNTAIALRSSLNSYASDLDAIKIVTDNTTTQTFTFTFSQANSSTAVTYRLYSYSEATGGSGGPGDGLGNDIIVNGTTSSSCTPPLTPTGTISGTTPACNSTSLTFSGSATAPVVNYWQTSATGTSTANTAANPLTANTFGTTNYYVRAFNSSTSCWSTSAVDPFSVTVNAQTPTVLVSPGSVTISEGNSTSFIVTPNSSVASYQWEVDTGSGFNNISNDSNYGGVTTATLAITNTPFSFNGYTYRCVVLSSAPCNGGAISTIGTLTVVQTTDNKSDLVYVAASSPATISSLVNDAAPLTSATGVEAMRFLFRDGGTTGIDTDNFPTILTGFTILQDANTASDWSAAIKTIALFDGTTFVASGVISPTSIVFSGLTVSTLTDGGSRTLSLRMSLNCPLGSVVDGEHFGFSISSVTTTVAASGSSRMTTFTALQNLPSTGGTLRIAVVATKLVFTTQPTLTGLGNTMSNVVVKAYDACNNLDTDFTGAVSLFSSGTMTAFTPVAAVAGVATFSGIVHTAIGTNLALTATSTVTAAVSTTFNIVLATVLKTGDLVLIAYDNNLAGGDDGIRLLTMVDINPGTRFLWANATYETGGLPASNVRSDKWFECRADQAPTGNVPYIEFTYTGATVIPAASIFCITTKLTGTASTISAISSTGTSFTSFTVSGKSADGNVLLSHSPVNISTTNPDSMFLMQGSFTYDVAGSTFVGTVLSGVQDGGLWYDLADDLSGITALNSNLRRSRKHPKLLCASLQASTTTASYRVSYDVSVVPGNTTGTSSYLLGQILNFTTNWISSFAVCPAASPFVINPSDTFNRWTGGISTNWFDCNNWAQLSVPNEFTDVGIFSTATNDAVIDFTAPFSDTFSDVAKTRNLTVSGRKVQLEANVNNKLEVYGDLLINTIGVLDMADTNDSTADGTIKLKGNWTNSVGDAAFSEGNGTVEFVGTAPQLISSVATEGTEIFYNVVLDNNFDTGVSNDLIASGDLTIKSGRTVNIDPNGYIKAYKALNHSGDLTIQSNGQLIQVDDTNSNTGTYTGTKFQVTRNYTATNVDYVYWGTPTKSFAVSNLPTGYRYEWNPLFDNTNLTQGNWITPSTATMTAGKGYIARTFNGSATNITLPFTFRGEPNNGNITVPISRGNYFGDGTTTGLNYTVPSSPNRVTVTRWDDNWNLVSNPYPSAINALTFLSNNSNIEGFVYFWTHQQGPVSTVDPYYNDFLLNYSSTVNYVLYNSLGVSSGPASFNGKIASGQGFFVLMSDGSPTTSNVTFNNSMRYTAATFAPHNNSQFFKTTSPSQETIGEEEKHRIWLDIVSAQGDSNRTLIGYVENATIDKDRMYDAITRLDNSLKIVSYLNAQNPQEFIIQGRGLPFNENDSVCLGVVIPASGTYKIGIGALDGMFYGSQNIYIEDKLLNIIQSIKTEPYTFTANSGQFNNRFVLRYTDGSALDNPNFETLNNSVVVATNQGELTIKSSIENIQDLIVYDILGRQLFEAKGINNTDFMASNISMSQQTLIVKIRLENGVTISRKIIL